MSYQNVTLKARGIYTFPNMLDPSVTPEGSMSEANNVVIDRDSVINPRRGFKFYGDSFGVSSARSKQLMVYKDRLLNHWNDELDADSNGEGTFVTLKDSTGANAVVDEVRDGFRLKYIEANGNLYFTSSLGIRKVSTLDVDMLSTSPVTLAGGIPALDGQAALNDTPGWFLPDSVVAYRVVWGTKDANSNLILGVPSERIIIENSLEQSLVDSYNQLLLDLDSVAAVAPIVMTGDTHTNTTIDGLSSTTNLSVGMLVTGAGVLANTAIASISNSTTIILDTTTIATASGVSLSFGQALSDTDYVSFTIPSSSDALTLYESLKVLANDPSNKLDTDLSYPGHTYTAFQGITLTPATDPSTPATSAQLNEIQEYFDNVVDLLNTTDRISQYARTTAIGGGFTSSSLISSKTVDLTFTIPDAVTVIDFYQIYRSALFTSEGASTLADLEPDDELRLIYEGNPTSAEIIAQSVTVFDNVPETFRDAGANLYTNQNSGEGILQANYAPPKALDITSFRQSTFFANTSTYYTLDINLLTAVGLAGGKITIANATNYNTYTFVNEVEQEVSISPVAGASYFSGIGAADYFTIYPANNTATYQIWFNTGTVTAPSTSGGKTNLECTVVGTETIADMCNKIATLLNNLPEFVATSDGTVVNVINVDPGYCNAITETVQNVGFTVSTVEAGAGENVDDSIIGIPDAATPAQQVDGTARSLVRVINKTLTSFIYASYASQVNDLPGKVALSAKNIDDNTFYIAADSTTISQKFNPDFGLMKTIGTITVNNPATFTCTAHGLASGAQVIISGTTSTPSIDGVRTVTVLDANTLSVPVNVTSGSSGGALIALASATVADNEITPNRLYFSKTQQPEAVPLVNYLDVGPKNKAILRILPLRESLFIFTEAGIYRLAGNTPSDFSVSLFDSSATIRAPDSAVVLNNQIYLFSTQGVSTVSDTGVSVISRPIEDKLLPLTTPLYPNFNSSTFAVSYESDRAYLLFTLLDTTDESATICYRFNTFTNTWVSWDMAKTCGVIIPGQDVMYLGPADANRVEIERKSFTRLDHADREFEFTIPAGGVDEDDITLLGSPDVDVGDVFVQTQYLTINQYNRVLKILDLDIGLNQKNYFSTLEAVPGDNLRNDVTALAIKLDTDSGLSVHGYAAAISGFGSSFLATQNAFNVIVVRLKADVNTRLKNYKQSTNTYEYEIPVTAFDAPVITLAFSSPLIAGPIVQYKRFISSVTWDAITMGDPSMLKQVTESTILFENMAFTRAKAAYSSDLSPGLEEIPLTGEGTGIWGSFNWGQVFWGGLGTSRPYRTFIPRNKQRCRFINGQFTHFGALENYSIFGISFTYTSISSRGYR